MLKIPYHTSPQLANSLHRSLLKTRFGDRINLSRTKWVNDSILLSLQFLIGKLLLFLLVLSLRLMHNLLGVACSILHDEYWNGKLEM
jgi:hypothetical protein